MKNTISAILTRRLISGIIDDKPVIHKENCINSLYDFKFCMVCSEACRQGAIEDLQIDYTRCIDCNICTVACPVQTIIPSEPTQAVFNKLLKDERKKVAITCSRQNNQSGLRLNCFASIPWEIWALILEKKKIRFSFDQCKECENHNLISKRLEEVKYAVGMQVYSENLIDSEPEEKDGFSRRELFKSIKPAGKQLLRNLLMESDFSSFDGQFYRILLKNEMKQNHQTEITFKTPVFSSTCWGCSMCVSKCPNGALKITDVINMLHFPWKCMHCGICIDSCSEGGLIGWKKVALKGDSDKVIAT